MINLQILATERIKQLISSNIQVVLIGPLWQNSSLSEKLSNKSPHAFPLSFPSSGPFIFIDGGNSVKTFHKLDGLSIGDGDSAHPNPVDILLPTQKDDTDLFFVLKSLPLSLSTIFLYGFIGGRLDHQIAVLGDLYEIVKKIKCMTFLDDKIIIIPPKLCQLELFGTFSLFSFQKTKVTLTGNIKYKLNESTSIFPFSGHGISNHAYGKFNVCAEDFILIILPEC